MKLKSPSIIAIHVALTSGHAITIGPEGRDVPQMFIKDAFSKGAIPAEMEAEDFSGKEQENSIEKPKEELLQDGIKRMLVENAEDFTGAGLPNRKVLSGIVGWNVSAPELADAWAKVQEQA